MDFWSNLSIKPSHQPQSWKLNAPDVLTKDVGKTQLNTLFQYTLELEHDGQIASFKDSW